MTTQVHGNNIPLEQIHITINEFLLLNNLILNNSYPNTLNKNKYYTNTEIQEAIQKWYDINHIPCIATHESLPLIFRLLPFVSISKDEYGYQIDYGMDDKYVYNLFKHKSYDYILYLLNHKYLINSWSIIDNIKQAELSIFGVDHIQQIDKLINNGDLNT